MNIPHWKAENAVKALEAWVAAIMEMPAQKETKTTLATPRRLWIPNGGVPAYHAAFDLAKAAIAAAREPQTDRDKAIIALAKKEHNVEGEVEVDDNAIVSESGPHEDNGAYVQAWVWVSFDGTEFDKEPI